MSFTTAFDHKDNFSEQNFKISNSHTYAHQLVVYVETTALIMAGTGLTELAILWNSSEAENPALNTAEL